jgi:hypothetical protein
VHVFSSKIVVPAGATLAGFADRVDTRTTTDGVLEVHGLGFEGVGSKALWELCSIDALYAGTLAANSETDTCTRVFAASHTHYAPMLDPSKPMLGVYSERAAIAFAESIRTATRTSVHPDRCVLLKSDVPVPIYRRFDFPRTVLNRVLTRFAGFYPNGDHPVDRGLYLLAFMRGDAAVAVIAYHACHPTTRHGWHAVSADYIDAIRQGVRQRFGISHCVFLLGCSGDLRPNLTTKRVKWLPRNRLNWRFKSQPSSADQDAIDTVYRQAVFDATPIDDFPWADSDVTATVRRIEINGLGPVDEPQLRFGSHICFSFVPLEVSHQFHLDVLKRGGHPRDLIVSCAGNTRGYLPHPHQIRYQGYEVDGSRPYMGLRQRVQADSLVP